MRQRRLLAAGGLVLLAACSVFAPFRDTIKVGEEPYAVFAAKGRGGEQDLYGMPPQGKPLRQITYGRAVERHVALSRDGAVVAFTRTMDAADPGGVPWLLNLVNGNERKLPLPAEAGHITALAFDTNATLVLRTDRGLWRASQPPGDVTLTPVPPAERAHADSLFLVLVGEPVFARVETCAAAAGLCAVDRAGEVSALATAGRDPVRWGRDSVAWWSGDTLVVRPLGPGRSRRLVVEGVRGEEGLAYFPGR